MRVIILIVVFLVFSSHAETICGYENAYILSMDDNGILIRWGISWDQRREKILFRDMEKEDRLRFDPEAIKEKKRADSLRLKTIDGNTYEMVRVTKRLVLGVNIEYESDSPPRGHTEVDYVSFDNMSDKDKVKYGYDPVAAKKEEDRLRMERDAEAEKAKAAQEAEATRLAKLQAEEAEERAEQYRRDCAERQEIYTEKGKTGDVRESWEDFMFSSRCGNHSDASRFAYGVAEGYRKARDAERYRLWTTVAEKEGSRQ